MPGAGRAVVPAASQDHGGEAGPEGGRSRLEQEIDRWRDRARLGGPEMEFALDDLDEPVRGDDEDHAVLERRRHLDDLDGHRGVAGEDLVEVTRPTRIEVLRDDDRSRELRG